MSDGLRRGQLELGLEAAGARTRERTEPHLLYRGDAGDVCAALPAGTIFDLV